MMLQTRIAAIAEPECTPELDPYRLIALARTEWSANSFLGLTQCFDTFFQANTLVIR